MKKIIKICTVILTITAINSGCSYPEKTSVLTSSDSTGETSSYAKTTQDDSSQSHYPEQESKYSSPESGDVSDTSNHPDKLISEASDASSQTSIEEPQISDEPSEVSIEEPQPSDEPSEVSIEEPQPSDEPSEVSIEEPQPSDEPSEVSIEEPQPSDEPSEVSIEEPQPSDEPSEVSIEEPQPSDEPSESDSDDSQNSEPDNQTSDDNSEITEKPDDPIVNAFSVYTSEKVYADIDKLCKRYPDLITQYDIGRSEKYKPLVCVTLGNGNKKACIVAGIHSREHITISFTMRCIEEYAEAYVNNELYEGYDVRQLLDEYTLYFLPMCNPDGTDISTSEEQPLVNLSNFNADSYKLNANGVNLNRNFPINWEEYFGNSSSVPGDEVYPGKSAGSESETEAIISLCEENDFLWLLDMHVLCTGILWRDSYNGEIENDRLLASSLSQKCGYFLLDNTNNPAEYSGGLENWFRYKYGRPSLCIEMIPYSQAYFSDTYSGYNSYFEDAVNWRKTKYTYLEAMACI